MTVSNPKSSSDRENRGRAYVLDEIEPSPGPVDGGELMEDLVAALRRFVALPHTAAHACALWILFAHTFDAHEVSPRLFVTSPEKRCGKTTLLKVIQRLVPRPIVLSNASPAAMFRLADAVCPTLIFDEADGFVRNSEDFRILINAGHDIDNCEVTRMVGEGTKMAPCLFRVWCPFVIAAIGRLHSTIEDRSIIISMSRRKRDEIVEKARRRNLKSLELLAGRAARWAADNAEHLSRMDPGIPTQLNDRAADNWEPLLRVADQIGGQWSELARTAALALDRETGIDDEDSAGVMVLSDCWQMFEDMGVESIRSFDLVDALIAMEGRPWIEWRRGQPMTQNSLARLLKPFAITPTTLRADIGGMGKGYYKRQFKDAYERYVSGLKLSSRAEDPDANRNTVTNGNSLPNSGEVNRNKGEGLLRMEGGKKHRNSEDCYDVTDELPQEPWRDTI